MGGLNLGKECVRYQKYKRIGIIKLSAVNNGINNCREHQIIV
jgi:hypothetical protein